MVQTNGHLSEKSRVYLMMKRAELYDKDVYDKGAPLGNYVIFIEYTDVSAGRPKRDAALLILSKLAVSLPYLPNLDNP